MSAQQCYDYPEICRKPENLLRLLNKYIEVRLVKNCCFQGYVKAVDPITYSMIILISYEDTFRTSLILGHAIISITELTPAPHIKLPESQQPPVLEVDLSKRKAKVKAWLTENLLPVSESGDKILFGNASLLPPYTVADICTNNPMVAIQMQKIIERMPQDFDK